MSSMQSVLQAQNAPAEEIDALLEHWAVTMENGRLFRAALTAPLAARRKIVHGTLRSFGIQDRPLVEPLQYDSPDTYNEDAALQKTKKTAASLSDGRLESIAKAQGSTPEAVCRAIWSQYFWIFLQYDRGRV